MLLVPGHVQGRPTAPEEKPSLPAGPVRDRDDQQAARFQQLPGALERTDGIGDVLERMLEGDEPKRAGLPRLVAQRALVYVGPPFGCRGHRRRAGVDAVDLPAARGEVLQQVARAAAHIEHAARRNPIEHVRLPAVAVLGAPAAEPLEQPVGKAGAWSVGISLEVIVLARVVASQRRVAELRQRQRVLARETLDRRERSLAGHHSIASAQVCRAQGPAADRAVGRGARLPRTSARQALCLVHMTSVRRR